MGKEKTDYGNTLGRKFISAITETARAENNFCRNVIEKSQKGDGHINRHKSKKKQKNMYGAHQTNRLSIFIRTRAKLYTCFWFFVFSVDSYDCLLLETYRFTLRQKLFSALTVSVVAEINFHPDVFPEICFLCEFPEDLFAFYFYLCSILAKILFRQDVIHIFYCSVCPGSVPECLLTHLGRNSFFLWCIFCGNTSGLK